MHKSSKRRGQAMVLPLALMMSLAVGPAAWGQNRLRNGGFEDLTAASQFQLAEATGNWWLNPGYPARVTAIEDPQVAHAGKMCLRVVPLDRGVGEGGQAPREGALSQSTGPLQPGEKYLVRFFARGLGSVAVYIYQYDKHGFRGSTASGPQQLSSNWREHRWYYQVPEGVENGSLALHVSPGGVMYLDDVLFAPIGALPTPPAIAEADVNGDGQPEIVMENSFLRLAVDPRRGAQVVSLVRKADGRELVPQAAKVGGLFADHDVSQPWPGEFMEAPYAVERVDLHDGSASVRFTYTTAAKKGSMLSGLRLGKTISLFADTPAIRCDVAFTNPNQEGRAVQYWMQNFVTASGDPGQDRYVRPCASGLSVLSAQQAQPEFVHEPVAGWTAVCAAQDSVIFTMDYDSLDLLYSCAPGKPGATTEWMHSKVAIPAGRTWQTTVWCLLTPMPSPTFASPDLVAGGEAKPQGAAVSLTTSLTSATRPLDEVQVTISPLQVTTRFDTPTGKSVSVETPAPIADWPKRFSQSLPGGWRPARRTDAATLGEGLWLFRVSVAGEALSAQYEVPVRIGAAAPEYQVTPPLKLVLRFEPEKLTIARDGKLDVLLIQDEYVKPVVERWRLQEMLQAMPGPPQVTVSRHSYIDWKMAGQLTFFPALMEDLLKYDVVILESADAAALSLSEQEMLRDYVKAGGGLLVLGGYYSFGKGRWEGTPLGELMPVSVKGPWDFVKVTAPMRAEAVHPALGGIDPADLPAVVWCHDVEPKPGAQVLLTAGGKPVLTVSDPVQGKVACFSATILGYEEEAPGVPLWKWNRYPALVQSIIGWLGREAE